MGTKNFNSATDLITFTRASGGTALRKISYGNELITNGTFDTDISGWTSYNSVISWDAGLLKVNDSANAGGGSQAYQVVTLEVGKRYRVTGSYENSTASRLWIDNSSSYVYPIGAAAAFIQVFLPATTPSVDFAHTFVATATTTSIALEVDLQGTAYFDNISVKEVLFDQADGTLQLYNHGNNVPRIEYDATGAVKGLLIEEARTNLLPYSSVLGYSKLSAATSTSTVVSPSGLQDAVLVRPIVATGVTWVYDMTVFNTGVVTTISTFAKASGKPFVAMANSNGNVIYASFNLTTGAVGTVTSGYTANMEDFGNGWYRCSVTTPTGFNERAIYAVSDTDGAIAAAANGNDGILLYGAQVEAGAFLTSYIPTTGAPATRAIDIAEIPTSAFGYNNGAGSIAVEFKSNKPSSLSYGAFVLSDGGVSNRILHFTSSTAHRGAIITSGVADVNIGAGSRGAPSELVKFAIGFSDNNFATSLNGATAVTDTSVTIPSGISKLGIGYYYPTNVLSNLINGYIKSIQYYPRRLTDTQLQELTT